MYIVHNIRERHEHHELDTREIYFIVYKTLINPVEGDSFCLVFSLHDFPKLRYKVLYEYSTILLSIVSTLSYILSYYLIVSSILTQCHWLLLLSLTNSSCCVGTIIYLNPKPLHIRG